MKQDKMQRVDKGWQRMERILDQRIPVTKRRDRALYFILLLLFLFLAGGGMGYQFYMDHLIPKEGSLALANLTEAVSGHAGAEDTLNGVILTDDTVRSGNEPKAIEGSNIEAQAVVNISQHQLDARNPGTNIQNIEMSYVIENRSDNDKADGGHPEVVLYSTPERLQRLAPEALEYARTPDLLFMPIWSEPLVAEESPTGKLLLNFDVNTSVLYAYKPGMRGMELGAGPGVTAGKVRLGLEGSVGVLSKASSETMADMVTAPEHDQSNTEMILANPGEVLAGGLTELIYSQLSFRIDYTPLSAWGISMEAGWRKYHSASFNDTALRQGGALSGAAGNILYALDDDASSFTEMGIIWYPLHRLFISAGFHYEFDHIIDQQDYRLRMHALYLKTGYCF